jgi:hypothetical protein
MFREASRSFCIALSLHRLASLSTACHSSYARHENIHDDIALHSTVLPEYHCALCTTTPLCTVAHRTVCTVTAPYTQYHCTVACHGTIVPLYDRQVSVRACLTACTTDTHAHAARTYAHFTRTPQCLIPAHCGDCMIFPHLPVGSIVGRYRDAEV